MGDRANYVLVGENGYELFHSQWGALTIDRNFLDGPDSAIEFVREQRADAAWLDDVWCEGAVLIDVPRRFLLLFTWHHGGVTNRKTWLHELAEAWPGWEIRWAYGGVEDVAAYVGVDRKRVRTEREPIERLVNEHLLEYPDDGDFVITIRAGGTLRGYLVSAQHCDLPWAGPKLVDLAGGLAPAPGRKRHGESDTGPESGVHIDVDEREVGVWTLAPLLGTVEELAACWPGWRFEFWEDRHEEQTRRCGEDFPMFPW